MENKRKRIKRYSRSYKFEEKNENNEITIYQEKSII